MVGYKEVLLREADLIRRERSMLEEWVRTDPDLQDELKLGGARQVAKDRLGRQARRASELFGKFHIVRTHNFSHQ